MLKIGITGGIGSGKSTACRIFEMLGIPIYYADTEAKRLMVSDPLLVNHIRGLFGNEAYRSGEIGNSGTGGTPGANNKPGTSSKPRTSHEPGADSESGASSKPRTSSKPGASSKPKTNNEPWAVGASLSLNREYISGIVFYDRRKLAELNAAVHPAVARDFERWAKVQSAPYIIEESAILFESGASRNMDYTVTVTAPEELRIRRVMSRDGVSEEAVRQRIANQMSEKERNDLADFIIIADEKRLLIPQVLDLHEKLCSL